MSKVIHKSIWWVFAQRFIKHSALCSDRYDAISSAWWKNVTCKKCKRIGGKL